MKSAFRLAMLLWVLVSAAACTGHGAAPSSDSAAVAATPAERARVFSPVPMPAPNSRRTARGEPGPGYWQQRCDYTIAAALDEAAHTVTARAHIRYTNNSPDALSEIYFSLDQNLFNPASRGGKITKTGDRFGNMDGFAGGFVLGPITVGGRGVTMSVDDTIGRIDLPEPARPRGGGGVVEIDMAWSFAIPMHGGDRMGIDEVRDGAIFEIAQWFPSVCVYDDVHGWNILPYVGMGEFYTNLGRYDVRLTVPRSHIVAATGVLQNPEEVLTPAQRERLSAARATDRSVVIRSVDEVADPGSRPGGAGGTLTWHFVAEDVRTFAWASSAAFAWDACTATGCGPGSNGEPGKGAGTLCQSFYPREAAHVWGTGALGGGSTQMLRASLEHYSAKWYAYPYPTATNVSGRVGGMEYPMIVFCGGGRASPDHTGAIPSGKDAERGLFGVTTHEIGHNWFPMLVNTDERRHAWMDEGFNTFINYYAGLERYPDVLPHRGNARVWARGNGRVPSSQPLDTPADELAPGTLGRQQYEKTCVGLVLLREAVLGPERFDAAFRAYIRRWAFKSPRPWDFFRTMEDVSGVDLSWFWRGWFYETGVLDQAVVEVEQLDAVSFERVGPEQRGGSDRAPANCSSDSPPPAGSASQARVAFASRGQLAMPLVFRVTYEDGTEETRTLPAQAWSDGAGRCETTWETRGRRIKRVVIDPDEEFPDVELSNNRWPR